MSNMIMLVETPDNRLLERDYILHVLLGEFLGVSWQRVSGNRSDIRITLCDYTGQLRMPDCLLSLPDEQWLTTASLPVQPLALWDSGELGLPLHLVDSRLPVIYGDLEFPARCILSGKDSETRNEKRHLLPLDIFGSVFFMLTRYEEIVKPDRDEHDRFPAWSSLMYKENFLLRPIVDEYTELLWAALKNLWPGLERKNRTFRVFPTHDVDLPFDTAFQNPGRLIIKLGGDLIIRRSLKQAANRAIDYCRYKKGKMKDPFDTFDWLLDQSESAGCMSAFYFKASKGSLFDLEYSLQDSRIQALFEAIRKRGHEIGFHPGYQAGMDGQVWQAEYKNLKSALPDSVQIRGGRQHFLRFRVPETWHYWSESDLEYDSTLGFADQAGFRCGTSHSFPVFDIKQSKQLDIVERPLIVMECSVLDERYMGMKDMDLALEYIQTIKGRCRMYEGEFVILWHNSRVICNRERELYQKILCHKG